MNRFGERSLTEINTCHKDLRTVLFLAISRSDVDFGVHEGARTVEEQQMHYRAGKSNINPIDYPTMEQLCKVAHHITLPGHDLYKWSRAADIHVAESFRGESLAWHDEHLCHVAGVIISCSKELYERGVISHLVRWGGDWNRNGVISKDQRLDDKPHFELYKPNN